MTPRILYVSTLASGERISLSPEESHHLSRVLRAQAGQEIELIDGKGHLTKARLTEVSPKLCRAETLSTTTTPPHSRVHLAFGLPKSAALDFIIHRVTEAGVRSFQPLLTQHSLHTSSWNTERWQKVIAETAKQCQELWFPELRAPIPLESWLKNRPSSHPLVVCDEANRRTQLSKLPSSEGVNVLVGPEGGWSREEIALLETQGAVFLGLGQNRLRAETAALLSVAYVKHLLSEM